MGSFVAWSLSFYEKGVQNSVDVSCDDLSARNTTCHVTFSADSAGESPWACGLRFKLKTKSWTIDRSSFHCTGSC